MAINRSSFTEANNWEIDSFTELYDLSPSQLAQAQRYQLLKMKASKTQLEITELNTLSLTLKDYLITPERWNKFSDALVNMELLLSTEIMDYIEAMQLNVETFTNNKKAEMDTHIITEKSSVTTFVNGKETQIQTTVDNALLNIEQKKSNIIEYMDGTTAGQIRNDIGLKGELTTTDKTSLVSAINELNSKEVDMTPVNNHIADKDNPHEVTATQVGAYTKIEVDTKLTNYSKLLLDGSANFNSTLGTVIPHSIGHTNYRVVPIPTQNPNGYLGEVWIDKSMNSFKVLCSGTATTSFDYIVVAR